MNRIYWRCRTKLSIVLSLLVALASATAPSLQAQITDISGTWVAKTQTPMGDLEILYELKVKDGKITGTQKLPFGDAPIVDSKIDGENLELTVKLEMFGNLQKTRAKGKIAGDTLEIIPALPKPPEGAGGPGGPPPMMSGPLTFHRGKPAPSNRPPSPDYKSLAKVELPPLRDLPYGLAATPPMGWNSWNKFHTNIDMKSLADYVHSKSLKLGIYSSPGPRTCGGFEGSYSHEEIDAKT